LVAFGFLGLVGFLGGGLIGSIYATEWMATRDPRDRAGDFVKARVEDGEAVGIVRDPWFWSPTLYPEIQMHPQMYPGRNPEEKRMVRLDQLRNQEFPIRYVSTPEPDDIEMLNPDLVTEAAPKYIVFSSFEFGDVERLLNMDDVPEAYESYARRGAEFVEALEQDYRLVKMFGQDAAGQIGSVTLWSPLKSRHDLEYVRPTVWVWKHKDYENPSSSSSTTSGTTEAPATTP
jgi:hypothetical protein